MDDRYNHSSETLKRKILARKLAEKHRIALRQDRTKVNTFKRLSRGAKAKSRSGAAFTSEQTWFQFGALRKARKVRRWRASRKLAWAVRKTIKRERSKLWALAPWLAKQRLVYRVASKPLADLEDTIRTRKPKPRKHLDEELLEDMQSIPMFTLFDYCQAIQDYGNGNGGRNVIVYGDPFSHWQGCTSGGWQRQQLMKQRSKVRYWLPGDASYTL